MAILYWGCAIIGMFFVVHWLIWQVRIPRFQTRALLGLALLILLATLGVLSAGGVSRDLLPVPASLPEYCQISLFVVAFALAYTITYSAIEADSPTLVMIQSIVKAGPEGLPEQELLNQVSDELLIMPRMADLVRDGMLVKASDRYQITAKGRSFIGIFVRFQKILGTTKGG